MKDWICFFFGHKYQVTQKLSPTTRRLCCKRCRKMFAMSDDIRTVLPWDAEFHNMYKSHGHKMTYLEWEKPE